MTKQVKSKKVKGKSLLFLTFAFCLLPFDFASALPTYDATATTSGSSINSLSVNITIGGSCTNTLVLVGTGFYNGSAPPMGNVTSSTVGGSAATLVDGATSAAFTRVELWRRIGVATGVRNVVVNYSAVMDNAVLDPVSYCGVNQTTPLGTAATAGGGGADLTPTVDVTSASGELVIDAVITDGFSGTLTVGGGQTGRVNDTAHPGFFILGMSEESGAGTVTMSWTLNTDDYWAIVGVSLKPAAAAAATRRRVVVVQ